MPVQNEWRKCDACLTLWYGGDASASGRRGGFCLGTGGSHRISADNFSVLMRREAPEAGWQPGWSRCGACFALFDRAVATALCAARGRAGHLEALRGPYCVATLGSFFRSAIAGWRRCLYCAALFIPDDSSGAGIRCPGPMGQHASSGGTEYFLCVGDGAAEIVGLTPPATIDHPDPVVRAQLGMLAVHAALLPLGRAGKVLYFAGSDFARDATADLTRLWDPEAPADDPPSDAASQRVATFTSPGGLSNTHTAEEWWGHDLFCTGHALLPDGSLLAAGGTEGAAIDDARDAHHFHWPGLIRSAIFRTDFVSGAGRWWRTPDMHTETLHDASGTSYLAGGRWYPTALTLADGTVLAMGGHPNRHDSRHTNYWVERYFPTVAPRGGDTTHRKQKVKTPRPLKYSKEPLPALAAQTFMPSSMPIAVPIAPSLTPPRPDIARAIPVGVPSTSITINPTGGEWRYIGDEPLDVQTASNIARADLAAESSAVDPTSTEQHGTAELYPRLFALPGGDVLCTRLLGLATEDFSANLIENSGRYFLDRTYRFSPLVGDITGTTDLSWQEVAIAPRDIPPRRNTIADGVSGPAYSLNFNLESAVLLPLREGDEFATSVLQVGGLAPWRLDLGPRAERATSEWRRSGWRLMARNTPSTIPGSPTEPIRRHCTAVLTPDCQVLVVGGNDTDGFGMYSNNPGRADRDAVSNVREVEQYDPVEERWSTLARLRADHGYHHSALLLPDGRIFVASDVYDAGNYFGQAFSRTIEVFHPPYLLRRPEESRPVVRAMSTMHIAAGGWLTIVTDQAPLIDVVALIRCGSVTHGFNSDQRCVVPTIRARGPNWLQVQLADPYIMIPGWYMVFVVDYLDVPSRGVFLQVVPSFGAWVDGR